MTTFVAQVRNPRGQVLKERVQAPSPREARALLRQKGYIVQDIRSVRTFNLKRLQEFDLSEMTARVTIKEKAIASRQLAVLVNSGVPIVRALGLLSEQARNPKLKKALLGLASDVSQGTSLSESMRKFPDVFDMLYVAMIQAGEVGGVLDEVLDRLSKLLEDNARLQNQIKSAMSYPLTVMAIAILVFLGMTIFLIPVFAGIFDGLGAELPAFTQAMLMISKVLRTPMYSGTAVLLIIAGVIVFQQYYRTPVGRVTVDQLLLKLPLFGDLVQKTATARFCRTFGSLTRAGVPILTSLEIVRDTSGNQVIANSMDAARREVQGGGLISLALQRTKAYPPMAIGMLSIGEETGEMDAMLMKVADFYEDEVEQAVKALTSMMEPLMIILVGGIVGSILLSMYLPMFSVFDKLK
jgi:type IV pilus assembly protein PilC